MRKMTENPVFSTGQIAKICGVAKSSIVRRIDSGELKASRIPGGQERRVTREDLVCWLQKCGTPLERLTDFERRWRIESYGLRILVVSEDSGLAAELSITAKREFPKVRLQILSSERELALVLEDVQPEVIIVDFDLDQDRARTLCGRVKDWDVEQRAFLVGLRSNGFVPGFDRVDKTVGKPCDPSSLIANLSQGAMALIG